MVTFCGIRWYKLNYHDVQACIEIICFILGIGSLGVPYAIAQAGPFYGFLSFFIMIALNIYTSILLSRCFLNVPSTITTFSDLGEYIFPKFGRPLVQCTQFTTCLLIPIAFFILAGSHLVPHIVTFQAVTPTMWICILFFLIIPIICIRNLKEAFFVMIIGAVSAFSADFLAVLASYTSSNSQLQNIYEPTEVHLLNVFSVFGTFALAYATALILPTIQRGHPQPERMPMNIMIGMGLVSIIYLLIAVLGYAKFGCSAPKNLLFMMTESIWKRIAFFSMLIHVLIALSMVSNPVFYYFEELLFSYQRSIDEKNLFKNVYDVRSTSTMNRIFSVNSQSCKANAFVNVNNANSVSRTPTTMDLEECNGGKFSTLCPVERRLNAKEKLQSITLRLVLTGMQAFLAILGQEAFSEIADFIGATSIASSCLIIPCLFYMKLFSHKLSRRMRYLCWMIIVFTAMCGIYTASTKVNAIGETLKDYKLFGNAAKNSKVPVVKTYPLCPKGYEERHKEL